MDTRHIAVLAHDESGVSTLFEIIQCCKEIETLAFKFYVRLGMASGDREVSAFWLRTAEEAWSLASYWEGAIPLAGRGMLPQIFDRPGNVRDELVTIIGKMIEMLSEVDLCLKDPSFAMTMAFKVEFYSIHRALVPLINLMKAINSTDTCPYDHFPEKLDAFLAMFKSKCHFIKPEMQLLAETIQRLWKDNMALSRECYFDELTCLLNRRGFYNAALPLLTLAKRRIAHVAMIVIDVDNFKRINDSLGHDAGDMALKKIAAAIKSSIRDSDISARYGGDEFVVFCPDLKVGTASIVAEKIRSHVEACDCDGQKLTISVGAAEVVPGLEDNSNEELASLFKMADSLLYEAKRRGRNICICQTHSALDAMNHLDRTDTHEELT